MASILVLGSTGMTGSHILSTLLSLPSSQVSSITTISRRPPSQTFNASGASASPKVATHVEKDTTKWESLVATANNGSATASMSPSAPAQILFSALATTRGAAGGFDKQYTLEHDLNVTLAKAARSHATGPTSTYVLISAASASVDSRFGYSRMKGEIERDILALEFPHTVILRPGLIGGRREESRPAEAAIRWIADGLGWISGGKLKDFWTQDADVIGRAAVRAGLRAQRGELTGSSTILAGNDIMELGRHPLTDEERQG